MHYVPNFGAKIVYVSCNPATWLKRGCWLLVQHGYRLSQKPGDGHVLPTRDTLNLLHCLKKIMK